MSHSFDLISEGNALAPLLLGVLSAPILLVLLHFMTAGVLKFAGLDPEKIEDVLQGE